MPQHYPFSAVLGGDPDALDPMGLALVLTSISPEIGGVLVRGEKGTAKSTTVRALASVLPPVDVYSGDRFSVDPSDVSATSPDGPFDTRTQVETRPARLVELPVGATEDRVLGSLHLERALSAGKVEFEPGLLAKAHRGVLYVDEVNLLHDHLVDLLLDAAAMGRVSVERDGVSVTHSARFVLIGTMNPEEGELRPQLLDRFGLTVEVAAPRDPALRAEVVRRRMAYDLDPAGFAARYQTAEDTLTDRIAAARDRLAKVRLSEAALLKIAEVCAAFEVDGLRADIVTARTALAHAAWAGRDEVSRADIRQAALLALPHRRRRNPFDAPGLDESLLDQILGDDELPPDPPEGGGEPDSPAPESPDSGSDVSDASDPSEASATADAGPGAGGSDDEAPPGAEASDDTAAAHDPADRGTRAESGDEEPGSAPRGAGTAPESVVSAAAAYRPRLLSVDGLGEGDSGRRSRAIASTGRRVGAKSPEGSTGSLHLVETLRAAAAKQAVRRQLAGRSGVALGSVEDSTRIVARGPEAVGNAGSAGQPRPNGDSLGSGERVILRPEDLRVAVREGREANLVLFCVDASGSMAARKRMTQVKTAILSLLLDAYRRRDKVGLVTFRGAGAELALPPTHSVDIAAVRLDQLPAGGRTPLAEGLLEAARVMARERRRDPRLRPLLVVVTDGRATHGKDAVTRSLQAADHLAGTGVSTVVVDSEAGPMRLGLARALAARLGAEHLPVGEVSAETLTTSVRDRTTRGAA